MEEEEKSRSNRSGSIGQCPKESYEESSRLGSVRLRMPNATKGSSVGYGKDSAASHGTLRTSGEVPSVMSESPA